MTSQHAYRVRFGWGQGAVDHLATSSDVVVVVDVLSFSTCIDVAIGRGAEVIPWEWDEATARERSGSTGELLAARRGRETADQPYTLSPTSLMEIPAGARLILPSPNGSTLARRAADHSETVMAGCLRNRTVVALAAVATGRTIAVIAAGELWPDGQLRPAGEDLLGAGAILDAIGGDPSPDAWLAAATFRSAREQLAALVADGDSGRELVGRGYPDDVRIAVALDGSRSVPVLRDGRFVAV